MNDIAIKYIKEDKGNGYFCFVPVGVIEGFYIEESNSFIGEDNEVYYPLTQNVINEGNNYCNYLLTSEEIRSTIDAQLKEKNISEGVDSLTSEEKEKFISKFYDEMPKEPVIGKINDEGTIDIGSINYNPVYNKVVTLSKDALHTHLLSNVVGQDEAIKKIVDTVFKNFTEKDVDKKQHIILTGPKGSGKSKIIRELCDKLYVANFEANVFEAGSGIISARSILNDLVAANNGDYSVAQRGIIVVDDLQKMINLYADDRTYAEYFAMAINQIMKRKPIVVDSNRVFDTSNLTVIIEGNFNKDIYAEDTNPFGFGGTSAIPTKSNIFKHNDDYEATGLTWDILNMSRIITTGELTRKYIKELMFGCNISPLVDLIAQCQRRNIDLTVTKGFTDETSKNIVQSGKGAHAIREELDEKLEYVNKKLEEPVKRLVLTRATALNPKNFEYYK